MSLFRRLTLLSLLPAALVAQTTTGASTAARDSVIPIRPPKTPLPAASATAGVTKFSFIAYGDTRGRHDGTELQAEHTLVVEGMLAAIKKAAGGPDPIRFVLQSGDAVVNGAIAKALTVSYIPIIERLTQEAGVPYFFTVGNHDVGASYDLNDPRRVAGMRNFLDANARLLPPDGSEHRLKGYSAFSFGFGNSYFIGFDSNIPEDTVQFNWVKAQLERLDRTRYVNVALFFHHPLFSSGPHGGATVEKQALALRTKWAPLFRTHHVRLLLTGHEHLYEHWVERYTDASGPHRMDQIVTGGGGAPLYAYVGEPEVTAYTKAGAELKVSLEHLARPSIDPGGNPFHFVIVHVDGDKIGLEVVGVDWGKGFSPYRSSAVSMQDRTP
jgi:3',5'-cyclic AMP phosphodiesterase CpdA